MIIYRIDLNSRLEEFQNRFDAILKHHLNDEIKRTEKYIEASIRPYVTFIRLEKNKIIETRKSLDKVKKEINNLKSQI